MTVDRLWLDVPFSEKDDAKLRGAKFDPTSKRWYAPSDSALGLERWLPLHPGTFTVEWLTQNRRRTFKLTRSTAQSARGRLAVMYLAGPNNEGDYVRCGWVGGGQFYPGKTVGSQITSDVNDFLAVRRDALTGEPERRTAADIRLLPSTHCLRCGRTLTAPESILSGLGPECSVLAAEGRALRSKTISSPRSFGVSR